MPSYFSLPKAPHKSFRSRMTQKKAMLCLGKESYTIKWFESTIWGVLSDLCFLCENIKKLQVAKMWIWKEDFASRAIPLFNCPRIYVRQCHISHLYEKCFRITFMLAIYLKMLCSCSVFKLYSRWAKDKCGGTCWWSLNSKFNHHLLHENTWNESRTIAIGFDSDKFHEFWCFHCLAGMFYFSLNRSISSDELEYTIV
jgi:hypothetical protein